MGEPDYPPTIAGSFLRYLNSAVHLLVRIAELLTLIIIFFITIAMISGVFFRFVLNSSIVWTDEISSLLLSTMMFVVIGIGLHERIHIGVGILFDNLPATGRIVLDVVLHLVCAVFFLIIFIGGIQVARVGLGMQLATVELPRGLFQLSAPVGAAFAFFVCLNNILKVLFGGDRPRIGGVD